MSLMVREPLYARDHLLACEHPLAGAAGLRVLESGGNAVDAAIAMSAVLCVAKPSASHLGGEAFIQVYSAKENKVTAVNASGPAPRSANASSFQGGIPQIGPKTCTVPGLVAAWSAVHARWGNQSLSRLLEPATHYAKEGFPVSNDLSRLIGSTATQLARFPASAKLFLPGGHAPRPGQILVQLDLAQTLDTLANDGLENFYRGRLAERIVQAVKQAGGFLSQQDLAEYQPEFLDPIQTIYRGYTIIEQPPNSQGYLVLEALNILEGFDLADVCKTNPARAIHLMAETFRLCMHERGLYAGDPRFVQMPLAMLLSKEHAAARRRAIEEGGKAPAGVLPGSGGDTTAFVVADRAGNVVSFIQSVYTFFGSCVVAGDTGILLNNRLTAFSLDEHHPNRLAPGKRPLHTLNNYMVLRDGRPFIAGGSPGREQQVQTNLQVLVNMLDLGMNVQLAVDAPRWGYEPDSGLKLESRYPANVVAELRNLRSDITVLGEWEPIMGRAQVLRRDPENGSYSGGSDSRGEGCVLGI